MASRTAGVTQETFPFPGFVLPTFFLAALVIIIWNSSDSYFRIFLNSIIFLVFHKFYRVFNSFCVGFPIHSWRFPSGLTLVDATHCVLLFMQIAMGRWSEEPICSIVDQEIRLSQAVPQSESSEVLSPLVLQLSFVDDRLNRVWDPSFRMVIWFSIDHSRRSFPRVSSGWLKSYSPLWALKFPVPRDLLSGMTCFRDKLTGLCVLFGGQ